MMQFDKIAVIGERELALGFKLIGIKDVFMETGSDAMSRLASLLASKDYNLVMVSESLRAGMDQWTLRQAETSLKPIVLFIPVPGSTASQESVKALAKRVLGVDINMLKGA
jgi:V/A-type H+-transporting ATPase subunit F